ncbi:MAG: UDP-N-acetylglucosamine 2-epimerase (hydrolyzing) [Flavobacteriaceae bacterium]|nr:UDP-N-acetylglucosamine 2-epimerase (hydrolyzing) [Flavobacteriaceae bacterium]
MNNPKKIVFLTGTRADFGKIKSLIDILLDENQFEVYLFVTGMHLMDDYGYTLIEIERHGYPNIYTFYNYSDEATMDVTLANTINGFSKYVRQIKPDMIVIHGDRLEALAASIVGSMNNYLVAHIEGGERSGTIDELMRHATSKLSHIHFVSNTEARNRLVQMGENPRTIHTIGSPDLDVMFSSNLPDLKQVKSYYNIDFDSYAVAIFHPITTELHQLKIDVKAYVDALLDSQKNYIVVYPNNDNGSKIILKELERLRGHDNFRVFPSLRFEYFLTLLKNADFIIGNSSTGIREAPYYSVPTINIGSRQNKRSIADSILNCLCNQKEILRTINSLEESNRIQTHNKEFGQTGAAQHFLEVLKSDEIWATSPQKEFNDL